MNHFNRLINSISEGMYFSSMKEESAEGAKNSIWYKIMVIAFFYYMSIVILFIGLVVTVQGPFKINRTEVLLFFFVPFLIIYRVGIYPHINAENININQNEIYRNKRKKLFLYIFIGGIFSVFFALTLVYFMYKIKF